MGAVLRAAVGVVQTARLWSAQGNSHVWRADYQILFHAIADSPAGTDGCGKGRRDSWQ